MRAIGLMSGTSLDGVDAALVETDGERVTARGPALTLPYPPDLRRELRRLLDDAPDLAADDPAVRRATAAVTEAHVAAVRALGERADIVGFHGQTILHRPGERRTWQIGDAAALARASGTAVAWDFRTADVAAGGQGAPFAPLIHRALAEGIEGPVVVVNIGGVANATWIGPELLACDTGPGNGPLDDFVAARTGAAFDAGGALARSGTPDAAALARLLDHPYFARPAPKSLDRLDFSTHIAAAGLDRLSTADGAATLAAFVARSIRSVAWPTAPRRTLVTGGGRHNAAIMAQLDAEPVEAVGWNGDALEAQCFGLLAVRVLHRLPLSFPGTTGVPYPLPGGRIAHP